MADMTTASKLTRTQNRIAEEIRAIQQLAGADTADILDYEPAARLHVLRNIRSTIVRGEVITQATLNEDYVDLFLMGQFFSPQRNFKAKKHRVFRDQVLGRMNFDARFKTFKMLKKHPHQVIKALGAIQQCRNKIAHQFTPTPKIQKVSYKGRLDIFTLEGFVEFHEDSRLLNNYFFKLLWGVSL